MEVDTVKTVKLVKDLKTLGPAPAGHTYAGSSLAYWRKHSDAFECYQYCKWDSGGKKQQVIVEIVPDVDSLVFHQGSSASWSIDDHDSTKCDDCGIVFRRNPA